METLLPEVAWSNGQRATSCLPGEPQPRAAQRGDGGAVLGGSGGSPWGEGALRGDGGLPAHRRPFVARRPPGEERWHASQLGVWRGSSPK